MILLQTSHPQLSSEARMSFIGCIQYFRYSGSVNNSGSESRLSRWVLCELMWLEMQGM